MGVVECWRRRGEPTPSGRYHARSAVPRAPVTAGGETERAPGWADQPAATEKTSAVTITLVRMMLAAAKLPRILMAEAAQRGEATGETKGRGRGAHRAGCETARTPRRVVHLRRARRRGAAARGGERCGAVESNTQSRPRACSPRGAPHWHLAAHQQLVLRPDAERPGARRYRVAQGGACQSRGQHDSARTAMHRIVKKHRSILRWKRRTVLVRRTKAPRAGTDR